MLLFFGALTHASAANAPTFQNPIAVENAQPGTSAWQAHVGGDIAVYATEITAAPGEEVDFHVSTANRYRLVVYRLGWYGGDGARQMACVPSCGADEQGTPQPQPGAPPTSPTDPPIRADWPVTDVVRTGRNWTSGYYLAEAVLTSGPKAGLVATTYFIVHVPAASVGSPILVQVPVNTWEAYNHWGGKSLYDSLGPRMYRVSFQRPFDDQAQSPLWWEIQAVRFLEREGYDVSYQTDLDTDRDPTSLLRHRLVMVLGHDEYWTRSMRDAFDNAVAQGTNLAFLGANEGYWHIEYQDNGQTIFGYKSLYDPNPVLEEKTALWRQIGRPDCNLTGVSTISVTTVPRSLDYTVTPDGVHDTWFMNTGLAAGDTIPSVVGREHDVLNPNPPSCQHPGLTVLFHYDGGGVDQDADAVKFTTPSGARVFAAGAMSFAWGLDDYRADGTLVRTPPGGSAGQSDPRLQQFMRNALDDLTRPAPPAALSATTAGDAMTVSIAPSTDPRVQGFVAALQRPNGTWRLICRAVVSTSCSGTAPRRPGVYAVAAGTVDLWHRRSAPTRITVRYQP
ncbi:MAG TPA: N,N-dimethylformamidase beta subunit family domain-containing protein [Gaiellaceae bacterium]|nr:N,N-dimethylformamidase beta subunit family domain-containing protein [Gaiellaceae bacterium]